MKKTIYKLFQIYILCNVIVLCIIHPKSYAQQDIKATLDKYIEKFIKEQNIPGAAVAIVHNKDVFFTKTWGLLGNLKKITSKTPFAIGSISKSLTALAIVSTAVLFSLISAVQNSLLLINGRLYAGFLLFTKSK